MKYDILQEELVNDPLSIGYSNMTNQEVADAMNAYTITIRKLVPLWQVKKACVEEGVWLAIQQAAESHSDPQIQAAANAAVSYIDDRRFENLDMDLASTKTMIGALVSGSVITQTNQATLDALADDVTSRAAQLELDTVTTHHIEVARARMGGE
jgi:hypothetical protein